MKTVFDVLDEKYEIEIAVIRDYVGDGKCDDYASYRDKCGQIRGLMVAKRELHDLLRKQLEADDE